MITILIATLNRPTQLRECLTAISANSYQDYEVLVLDQSKNDRSKRTIEAIHNKKIIYRKLNGLGKSKALNQGVAVAQGDIIAFTDDDCIVDRHWLREIYDTYKRYPDIAGVFGNTYPYKPTLHKGKVCPATFVMDHEASYDNETLVYYHEELGQGNNMGLKKSVILELGGFKSWLGVGSPAHSAEESELIFRILCKRHTVRTNPHMIVYHNRWITPDQERLHRSQYTYGLIAFYSYYIFTPYRKTAVSFMIRCIRERIPPIRQIIRIVRRSPAQSKFLIFELISISRGIWLGTYMSIKKWVS